MTIFFFYNFSALYSPFQAKGYLTTHTDFQIHYFMKKNKIPGFMNKYILNKDIC